MKKILSLVLGTAIFVSSIATFANGSMMMKDDKMMDTSMMNKGMMKDDKMMTSQYVDYVPGIVSKNVKAGKTVVLFFHADRCPTCISLDKDITSNMKDIPSNMVIVKANYDTAKNLKKIYKVKSQNALVVVNKKGKIVARSKGSTTTLVDVLKLIK